MKNNKTLVLVLLALMGVFSCQKTDESVVPSFVSVKDDNSLVREGFLTSGQEYKGLTPKQKGMADLLNSAIAGLEALNAQSLHSDYEAFIMFSDNNNGLFTNFVTLAKRDKKNMANARVESGCDGSCDVSGLVSTTICIKAIVSAVDSCGDLSITVSKNKDGSYHVTWKKAEL